MDQLRKTPNQLLLAILNPRDAGLERQRSDVGRIKTVKKTISNPFMWISAVLLLLLLLLSFKCWRLWQREVWASFIEYQCEQTQSFFIENPDMSFVADALPQRVEFLISYYHGHNKKLSGSMLDDVVQKNYTRTLTNAINAYQKATGKDMSEDIEKWTLMYNR